MKRDRILLALAGLIPLYPWSCMASEGKTGLPQLDATLYPGLLFWLVLCFPVFFIVMYYKAVPAIEEAKTTRKDTVDADLAGAGDAQERAKTMMVEGEKALANARESSLKMVEKIVLDAQKEAAAQQEKQKHALDEKFRASIEKISRARVTAMNDVPKAVDEAVAAIVAKLTA